ncbi:MAG: phytoene desaturase family protein [Candidatus Promineifilaceae bacterium]|nr:phytoene desaturase family protein [Candidatus Promineifilaceae bacterium]
MFILNRPQVVVIGAGVGGIATAAHLARHGLAVKVIEKNARPGGRSDRFVRDGHHFDAGPTLFVMPLLYEAEFAALGVSMHEVLDLQRVDPTYHLVFDDYSRLELTSDMKCMREQLEAIEPGSFHGLLRYLDEGCRHYQLAMEKLVNRDFRSASEFFALQNLPLLFQLKPLAKHYEHMGHYFKHPRLKSAFTFQDVYMGLSPFEAPATFSMMQYTELAHGVWYPRGGMYTVVEALMAVAREAGVEFEFGTAAEQIDVNGSRARGVTLEDGRFLQADAVVANADLPYVYRELLPANGQTEKLLRKRYSCSTISFFWGVDKAYPRLPAHTLFLADDYRENFTAIIDDLGMPENPSLYVHAPARLDPAMAPPGEETLIAIVPVGHLADNGGQDWRAMRDRAREIVLRRLAGLGFPELHEHIKFEVNYTPLSWRKRYNLVKGATHGLGHTLMQLGYMRPHNRHSQFHNLYFTGASTHPGTGMPTALVSGRHTAVRVVEESGLGALC